MERSQTAYVILGMLAIEADQSGYDIRKCIECSVHYFWRESFGQIYPTLKRLAAEGLIVRHAAAGTDTRQRQRYSLTAAGRACLHEWLARPYRDDPPRDEFLLKLFFGREADPGVLMAHVRDFQDRNRRFLATILELEKLGRERQEQNPNLPFWLLTASFGAGQVRSALAWSETALACLSKTERETARRTKRPSARPQSKRRTR